MLYSAALASMVFRSAKSVALTVPPVPTLVRIWIMSARLSEPAASSLATRAASTGSFSPPGDGVGVGDGDGVGVGEGVGAVIVTLRRPISSRWWP